MEFQNFPLMKWHTAKTYVFRYVYICCIFLQNCRVRSNTSNVNTMIKSIQRVLHRGQKYADIWAEAFVISYKAVLYEHFSLSLHYVWVLNLSKLWFYAQITLARTELGIIFFFVIWKTLDDLNVLNETSDVV